MHRSTRIAFLIHVALFCLVVTGVVGRGIVPYWTAVLLVWAASYPVRVTLPFFSAALPLFLAIPLTPGFDNFTMWRPLALVLGVRWLAETYTFRSLFEMIRGWLRSPRRAPSALAWAVFSCAVLLSVTQAADVEASLRRIILFANAAIIPLVVHDLGRRNESVRRAVIEGLGVSACIIAVVGLVQVASTYVVDIYSFMRIWGEGVQLRQYGELWSQIVVRVGNTWFSYFGPQLSLRVFSLLPDSHSMPVYLLLALTSLIARAFVPIAAATERAGTRLVGLLRTRGALEMAWVALCLLIIVLSGTRGIWAAYVGTPFVVLLLSLWMRRHGVTSQRRALWRYYGAFLGVFAACFLIAWPVFISPQFRLGTHGGLLANRIRSIVDFGETSNSHRLAIWKLTLRSIAERPLLGVGIGNFPRILDQAIIMGRAGSSAHNLWLHVASEAGLVALASLCAIWLLWYRAAYRLFTRAADRFTVVASGWLLIAIPWVAAYLLTDAALMDERALLAFGITLAWSHASLNPS
jgi:O-antigen ligase